MDMAKVMPAPIWGSFKAPMNVAIPSGKLCMAMANADMIPSLCRAFSFPVCSTTPTAAVFASSDSPDASCGFSYSGIRKSIRVIMPMPPKNASRTRASPCLNDPVAMISACASGKSSASEMNIITPALNPSAPASVLLLSFFLKSTSAPPMPVAAPAINVNINAPNTPVIICFLVFVLP